MLYVMGEPCPRKKHPGEDGRVRWLGLKWEGVPYPVRFYVWFRWMRDKPMRAFVRAPQGCGCIAGLKTAWRSIHEVLRRVSGRNP